MLSLGHGKFRSLLAAKKAMYGCTIIERLFVTVYAASLFVFVCLCEQVGEEWTTRTCASCGTLNQGI